MRDKFSMEKIGNKIFHAERESERGGDIIEREKAFIQSQQCEFYAVRKVL